MRLMLTLLTIGTLAAAAPLRAAPPRPNVLLIMADDMGFSDVGCYGGEIATPNIDRLAARGVRFRNFYNDAKCEITRASLLTGQWWPNAGGTPTSVYACPTFGERLRGLGYRTLMSGKWHAGQTPFERGFDRYFGLTDGCCNYWNPGHARPGEPEPAKKAVRRWAIDGQTFHPYTPDAKDFYTTDAFTDHALKYLDQYKGEGKPFLLYLAFTAPHYPLQAPRADVEKYRGKYLIGWDELRRQRFARQQRMGVLPPGAKLTPRDGNAPAWQDVPASERDGWDLRMATYAAMIEHMDRAIGRVLAKIDELGQTSNTVVFFLSDNGASSESSISSTVPGAMPWEVTSYLRQGLPWANASNTPFRRFKSHDYEGGTHTPMIAVWPGVIRPGTFTDFPGHLIDFTPTLLELAGPTPPGDEPLPGVSLVPAMKGETASRPTPLFWEIRPYAAAREGDWKLVRQGRRAWELYDLAHDPTELDNLASAHPDRVAAMGAAWTKWSRSLRRVPSKLRSPIDE